jgi:3-dehydroquinate synthase
MKPTFELHGSQIFLGSLANTFTAWFEQQQYSQVLIIVDANTLEYCLPVFLAKTGLSSQPLLAVVSAGETQKNLATCEKIWHTMLSDGLDRKALVVNLGGGVIGDMGGFCAATWKRGVDFIHVPTTLLAMTDAAIGGKLGVDFHGLKNIIGVFRQPAAVFVDPSFLETLPERELRSGMAEVIKHALIGDPALLRDLSDIPEASSPRWPDILQASIAVKVHIVAEDPHEKGWRMLLNFGHTIGHAVESYFLETDDPLTHGEAVAIGMICETAFERRRDEVASIITRLFPHRQIPAASFSAIWALMQQDKKNSSGKVHMALPDDLPFSVTILDCTQEDIERRLSYFNDPLI